MPQVNSVSWQIRQTTELFICSELTRMKGVVSSDYPYRIILLP